MSKSKGNVVTPKGLLNEHGSDAVRYWAASSRLGTDAAFDPQRPTQIKIGRRLAIKVLNAAKLVLGYEAGDAGEADVTNPLDRAMLAQLRDVVAQATVAFDAFNHARALEVTESFFWSFCDDYLELAKERAYGGATPEGQRSAVAAMRLAVDVLLRLLAPFIPFATEEVWSWSNEGSVHEAAWPTVEELAAAGDGEPRMLDLASAALTSIRGAKTAAKVSQKTPMLQATFVTKPGGDGASVLSLLEGAAGDIAAVGRIESFSFTEGAADDVAFAEGAVLEVRDIELGEPPVKK